MKMKDSILVSGLTLSRKHGLMQVTRELLAEHATCSAANISYHFGSMDKVRAAIVEFALSCENLEVLTQARVLRHPALRGRLSPELKGKISTHMLTR